VILSFSGKVVKASKPLMLSTVLKLTVANVTFPAKRQRTEETISMKLTWYGHSAFRIEAGAAKILIDPFLSDNPSWDKGWSGYLAGKNSTQGGDR
jgi:beta-lactamase family protein